MFVAVTSATTQALRGLPTQARPIVDPAHITVPEGYRVEAVVAGLSFPCGIAFKDGAIYVSVKGGYHTHIDRYDL